MEKTIQKVTDLGKKNSLFLSNHSFIIGIIESCIDENKCLPSVAYLKEQTTFSRKTIYEHLKYISYYNNDDEQIELVNLRRKRLMEIIYDEAIGGSWSANLKAIEMYLKYTDPKDRMPTKNNYIQINHFTIKQEQLNKLEPKILNQLIKIIEPNL